MSDTRQKNYYDILGLTDYGVGTMADFCEGNLSHQGLTDEEIEAAYQARIEGLQRERRALEDEFKQVQKAYDVLKDPITRAQYVAMLDRARRTSHR